MTSVFYSTRNAARAARIGKYVDHGAGAPKGHRYARVVSLSGNARQRRTALRAMQRTA